MKYLFQLLFLSFLFTSCGVIDPLNFNPIQSIGDPIDFKDNSHPRFIKEQYSDINLQTSKVNSQTYFTGTYFKPDFLESIEIGEMGSSYHYRAAGALNVLLDYNHDNKTDFFGFLTEFGSQTFGEYNGKFVIIEDFESDSADIKYYDAPFSLGQPEFEVGNFDQDDESEILIFTGDGHVKPDGTEDLTNSKILLVDITTDGSLSWNFWGHGSFSHQITSGDVDNDGDLDIMYYLYDANVVHQTNGRYGMFQLMKNNGDGTFIEQHPFDTFKNLKDTLSIGSEENGYYNNWSMTTVELFDLNNDDILDMVTSFTHDSCDDEGNSGRPLCKNNTSVYWGQGNGIFDMSDVTYLPNDYKKLISNDVYTFEHEFFPLSHSVLDYNNDGLMDLVSPIVKDNWDTGGYDGAYIQLHKNLGNGQFEDVTDDIFHNYPHADAETGMEFCFDYDFDDYSEVVPYDVDGDGDVDLVPNRTTTWSACNNMKDTFYRNDNGIFMLVNQ
jgi:hypothetical protein